MNKKYITFFKMCTAGQMLQYAFWIIFNIFNFTKAYRATCSLSTTDVILLHWYN